MGPVAEKTSEWNYVLSDGVNIPRQLTDDNGLTTLSVRYNPWGKIIETSGTGNLDESFIGMLTDFATGLIYVGNGQYYDPETGRFLTRGVNPNSTNPYVPWNPVGMLVGPLAVISANEARKKLRKVAKGAAATGTLGLFLAACDAAIVGLIVFAIVAVALVACAPSNSPQDPNNPQNQSTGGPGTVTPAPTQTPSPAVEPPVTEDPCANGQCTPTPSPTPTVVGTVGVFGGSQGSGLLEFNGPAIPGEQMTAWTTAPTGYTLWYSQYPGHHDYRLADNPGAQNFWLDPKTNSQAANGYAGKPGQARWAFEYANPMSSLPSLLVGYSAGADAAVLHAELRHNSGLPIKALALLDPAFDSYDLNGQYLDSAGYKQKLAGMGVRVLIVDTQSLWAGWSSSSITYCPIAGNHGTVDDDPVLREDVYEWASAGQIECNR